MNCQAKLRTRCGCTREDIAVPYPPPLIWSAYLYRNVMRVVSDDELFDVTAETRRFELKRTEVLGDDHAIAYYEER